MSVRRECELNTAVRSMRRRQSRQKLTQSESVSVIYTERFHDVVYNVGLQALECLPLGSSNGWGGLRRSTSVGLRVVRSLRTDGEGHTQGSALTKVLVDSPTTVTNLYLKLECGSAQGFEILAE